MSSRMTPWVLAALCLFAIVAFLYAPVVSDHPYNYDEADYMWAGREGIRANFESAHALSFAQFVKKGLELAHNSGERQSLSEYVRSSGDIEFYRHYHGPMYAYWLALLQDGGVKGENVFRGSGLVIHFLTATLILFGFRAIFPSLPPVAALVACALFVFNRSALSAATIITQHVLFTFFAVASLISSAMFLRKLDSLWFYVTLALISCAVCTVETSALLLAALGLSMLVERKRIRERWPTLKGFAGLVLRGTGIFVLTMLILWPFGVLNLGVAKGFLGLAYIAVYRKTFSPLGPLGLWAAEFRVSPWEFSLLAAGFIVAIILWRRFPDRRELLPWLAFLAIFFIVTLKVTVPYTYYYAPLTAAAAVVSAAAFGILWNHAHSFVRALLALAVVASVAGMTAQFRTIARHSKDAPVYQTAVLQMVENHRPSSGEKLYIPYQLVPTLHYYYPDVRTVGYDFDFPLPRLADGVLSRDSATIMFCEANFCDALERQIPGFAAQKSRIDRPGPNGQPFYLIQLRKFRSL